MKKTSVVLGTPIPDLNAQMQNVRDGYPSWLGFERRKDWDRFRDVCEEKRQRKKK